MLRRPELMGRRANVLDQGPIGRARETCENCPVSGEKNRKNYVMIKSTPTLTLTQSGLLAMLLQRQRYAVIQLARRRTHRKHMRAALWSALTWPWGALTAPRLDSRQAPGGNRATLESFTKVSCRSSPNPHLPQAPATNSPRPATVDTGCSLSTPSVPLYSCQATGSHRSAGLPLHRAIVRRFNVPRTTAKLPVLRHAKARAAVERAHAT